MVALAYELLTTPLQNAALALPSLALDPQLMASGLEPGQCVADLAHGRARRVDGTQDRGVSHRVGSTRTNDDQLIPSDRADGNTLNIVHVDRLTEWNAYERP